MRYGMKKFTGVCLAVVIICYCIGTTVKASGVAPCYENTYTPTITLVFNNNVASCTLSISGKSGTSKITGILKLYDVTDGKSVKSWTIYKEGSYYSGSKTADVKSGHKYKLSFSGTVYNASGVGEAISESVTKTN